MSSEITPPVRKKWSRLTMALVGGACILLLKFLILGGYWAWTLTRVPLIPEPFDVEQFVAELKVPDSENAVNDYLYAASLLKEPDWNKLGDSGELLVKKWEDLPEQIREFVQSNKPALNVWLAGTLKTRALAFDPESPGVNSSEIAQKGRSLARLIVWKAVQLQDEGKLDESWKCLAGGLKTSAHLAQGGQVLDHLVSSSYRALLTLPIHRWAEDPNLTPDQLRQALVEIDRIAETVPPISHTIKAEYLTCRDIAVYWMNTAPPGSQNSLQQFALSRLSDSANRLQRHAFRNILARCDLPSSERKWQGDTGLFLDLKPTGPELPSDRIAALGKKNVIYSLTTSSHQGLINSSDRELMRQSALRLIIALQLYHRENNAFPDDLKSLVPMYLKELPPNPFAPPGQTLHYRVLSDHIELWNVEEPVPIPTESNPFSDSLDEYSKYFWTVYPPGTRPPLYRPRPTPSVEPDINPAGK